MLRVDQLERGLIAGRDETGRRGDDPAATQTVEHRDLLLVEETCLDDLRDDHVDPAREIHERGVPLDDADAVRDPRIQLDAAPEGRR